MRKYFLLIIAFVVFSCDKKSKVEKAVEEIPVEMKVVRFEQAFFESKPEDLATVKAEYPEFFPEGTPDEVWLEKLQHPQWRELYAEVERKYKNFSGKQTEIEELFKHIKYYFPTIKVPKIYTVIGEMDYNSKVIYANDKLLIALELYLGGKHKFYSDFPEYISQNFEERQMLPDVVTSFANGVVPAPLVNDKTLLAQMIYYGKELYLKDILLSEDYTDAEKIGYTPQQITWSKENEYFIWMNFIENQYLFNTSPKLLSQFINLAPFSKFYLEIDNESPGRIGQWIGWQIVRSYMENNPKTTVQQLLKMDAKVIFEASKYKPSKNE
ncbi:gliding motility lipoprotein GldB [Flavobacterium sp.]|uniref:gliding motility lipoprotein GldB n=1 Tax=Flavobacterium sp. TaxID=239 RepID=UPI002613984E|nr:gliding motility lipoprotein GldB [Flavobacterium sp.]